ncbi:hypothetical protein HRG_006495 [Hirsutella rhossiliensis]|uniref:Up-regulated in Daf-2 domain-containing protein n=1 Tax=Hirsutella rhossiliensis TaxID=111463 RepID=A0A9P8MUI5_9HYPO|nr:uncharacterized protein HRG_06495 [Hirsutella rhossiliensis]KAH0962393.1 hypothetical protein HRG_06495 [Hirsutella rhossiliensis]
MQTKNFLYALLALVEITAAVPSSLERRIDWGTVKRTASVTIQNNAPEKIKSVSLIHKYSSVYKSRAEWPLIEQGKSPDPDNRTTVEYNTGPFTTGRDWWLLSFYNDDITINYMTNPNNFRDVVDFLESIGTVTTISLFGATAGVLAAAVAKATTDRLFDSETTVGFKQHILRSEDADKLTTIVINADYTITFKSESGISETVTARRVPDIQVKNEKGVLVAQSQKR